MWQKKMCTREIALLSLFLAAAVQGNDFGSFVSKYKVDVENFIMAGYGGGWDSCDIIAVSPVKPKPSWNVPQLTVDINTLKELDLGSDLLPSYCFLVLAKVKDNATMSAITEFGWTAIKHKRVGMILTLGSDITTLDEARNMRKLPFPIAAHMDSGREQFLCPSVGNQQPLYQHSICEKHLTNYHDKTIRVQLLTESIPLGFMKENGTVPDGVDINILKALQKKMGFKIEIAGLLRGHEQLNMSLVIYQFKLPLTDFHDNR